MGERVFGVSGQYLRLLVRRELNQQQQHNLNDEPQVQPGIIVDEGMDVVEHALNEDEYHIQIVYGSCAKTNVHRSKRQHCDESLAAIAQQIVGLKQSTIPNRFWTPCQINLQTNTDSSQLFCYTNYSE